MTVKELIEKLSQFPGEYTVEILVGDYTADIKDVLQDSVPDFDTATGEPIGEIKLPNVLIVEA